MSRPLTDPAKQVNGEVTFLKTYVSGPLKILLARSFDCKIMLSASNYGCGCPFYPNFHDEEDPAEENGDLILQGPCYELLACKVSARKLHGCPAVALQSSETKSIFGVENHVLSKFLKNEKLEPGGCGTKRQRIFRASKRTQACPAKFNRSGEKPFGFLEFSTRFCDL